MARQPVGLPQRFGVPVSGGEQPWQAKERGAFKAERKRSTDRSARSATRLAVPEAECAGARAKGSTPTDKVKSRRFPLVRRTRSAFDCYGGMEPGAFPRSLSHGRSRASGTRASGGWAAKATRGASGIVQQGCFVRIERMGNGNGGGRHTGLGSVMRGMAT